MLLASSYSGGKVELTEGADALARRTSYSFAELQLTRETTPLQVMRSESMRLNHERSKMMEQIKDNTEKIKNNKQLPYLVGNVVEVSNCSTAGLFVPCADPPRAATDPQHRPRRG